MILVSSTKFQVLLGVLFNNENINDEMVCILKKFQECLPHTQHENNEKFDPQLFSGDQLSVERAINVIQSVSNGYTEKDRLEIHDFDHHFFQHGQFPEYSIPHS